MRPIKLFTDSIADPSRSWIKQYDIGVVHAYVTIGEETLKDQAEITAEMMYRKVEEKGGYPRTAAPAPSDYSTAYAPYIEQGYDILHISISSLISSSYQNAVIAADDIPADRITVIDSLNLSAGASLLLIQAARAIERGEQMERIVDDIKENIPRVHFDVVVDKMDYLHKGGRVSGLQNMLGSLLNIRPQLKVEDGRIRASRKHRGKMDKAVNSIMEKMVENVSSIDPELVIIVQTLSNRIAESLRSGLLERTSVKEVAIIDAGCVICSHTGPHALGVAYMAMPGRVLQA
ncbi:DegV family protein [Paenibacillus sp. CAU 1782]